MIHTKHLRNTSAINEQGARCFIIANPLNRCAVGVALHLNYGAGNALTAHKRH